MIRAAVFALALLAPVGGEAPSRPEAVRTLPSPQLAAWRVIAAHGGQSTRALYIIAHRESRFQPDATNRRTWAAGMFQFMPRTWAYAREGSGLPASASPYNAEDAVRAAAYLYATPRGPRHWGAR